MQGSVQPSRHSTVADLPLYEGSFLVGAEAGEIVRLLNDEPLRPGVVICDACGEVVGALSRDGVMRRLHTGGLDADTAAVAELIAVAPLPSLTVAGRCPVHEAGRQALRRAGGDAFEPLIVLRPDSGPRLLSVHDLLLAQSAQLSRSIRAHEQALTEARGAEHRYREIFDNAVEAIFQATPDGCIVSANPAMAQLFGFGSPDELMDASTDAQWRMLDDAAEAERLTGHLIAEGRLVNTECRIRRADGSTRWVSQSARAVRDEDGYLLYFEGTLDDVTERREARLQLERAHASAQAAAAAKSEFLANMSHEIRTPMTAILGFADLLMDLGLSQSDRLNYVQTIRRNGEHLLRILNDILDLSKIEANKLEAESTACDPIQIVNDAASLMRVRASEKGLELKVRHRPPLPTVVCTDPLRLRQILINLIGNAIKFTETGSVLIEAACDVPGQRLELSVVDTGIGMDQQQTDRLFMPFQQVDNSSSRRFGGTGLGLTISRRLAELLGGDITIQSTPGAGSRFTVSLTTGPLDGVPMIEHVTEGISGPTAPPPKHADSAQADPVEGRVLLAEDGPDNQRLIGYVLRQAGLDVRVVENGRLAMEAATEAWQSGKPFDVILMDMQMPVMNGYEATALLRRAGYTGSIVALTAHAMAGDEAKCLEAGCDGYATKPIQRQRLIELIGQRLDARRVVP